MKIKTSAQKFAAALSLAALCTTSSLAQDISEQKMNDYGAVPEEISPVLKGETVITEDKTLSGKTLTSSKADISVILIKDGAKAELLKSIIQKQDGDTSNDDESNFYGLNAAIVVKDGSALTVTDVTITSDAQGSNAVFSTGEGSVVYIKGIKVDTAKDSSRGLDATYGGYISAQNVEIVTQGMHSASFATDRGEGTVIVNGGTALTKGEGSPVIYSTGDIRVKNLKGEALASQIAVIEGKNSVVIENSSLTGGSTGRDEVKSAVMIYQSMSGDAVSGCGTLTVKKSTLKGKGEGPFFYVTNTNAKIDISETKIINPSNVLMQVSGNTSSRGWGRHGKNGGKVDFSFTKQSLEGDIIVDEISSLNFNVLSGAKFKGKINSANEGNVNISLSKDGSLELTGDCYFNEVTFEDESYKNIKTNGYTLYYNKNSGKNLYLHGHSIVLKDGGRIAPYSKNINTRTKADNSKGMSQKGHPMGKDMVKISGVISVTDMSKNTVVLTDSEGVSYELAVMDKPGKPFEGNGGNMMGGPMDKNMDKPMGQKAPPKMMTIKDLLALDGKTVTVSGVLIENKIFVFNAE